MRSDNPVNPWNSFADEICWWTATFLPHGGPEVLLSWQDALFAAGEKTGIFRVDMVEEIDYLRSRDGFIGEFIQDHPDRLPARHPEIPRGFLLPRLDWSLPTQSVVSTLLTYAKPDGSLTNAWVKDMDPFACDLGLDSVHHNRPIAVTLNFDDAGDLEEEFDDLGDDTRLPPSSTYFSLNTDIWLPWTSTFSHRGFPNGTILDNRTIATPNAHRLNAMLTACRSAAESLGGRWHGSPRGKPGSSVTLNGIVIDAPRPQP